VVRHQEHSSERFFEHSWLLNPEGYQGRSPWLVSLEIHLPPLERNALRHLKLVDKDRVTRVTDTDQDSGFAATGRFEPHEIVV